MCYHDVIVGYVTQLFLVVYCINISILIAGTQHDSNRSEEQPQTSVIVVSDKIGKEKMVNTEIDGKGC